MATEKVAPDKAGAVYTELTIQTAQGPDTYSLLFDYNELCEAESIVGVNLGSAILSVDRCSATQYRGLLYALLRSKYPKITLERCGDLFSANFMGCCKAISKELAGAFPEEEPVEGAPMEEPKPPAE